MEKEFVNMINEHRSLIFKVCHIYGFEKDFKEDLFQEIIIQLWRSYPNFRRESKLSTWIYRVALNTAIGHFRKEVRKPKLSGLADAQFQLPHEDASDIDEKLHVLNEAIQQLTPVEKGIVMLYLEEKSYQDISDILGITTSNVGVKISRIKTKLEKIINTINYEIR